ncbi:secreted RxLR effector peptide protein, putative [Phytophthora infestans T30-4]|uniref:RxLR effector protein n=2 Tax=Phytophthora infestans TaxID=4787 RepID=A0A833WL03_PHYIN
MRVSYVLLVAVATLLITCDVVSAQPSTLSLPASDGAMIEDTNNQPLRLLEITTADDGEERMAEARLMDSEILEKIVNDHAYAKQVFRSWLQNGQTKEDIENRLKTLGLLTKYGNVVKQYAQYLTVLEERSA